MTAAVLLPAALVGLGAERLFLTVADRLDTADAESGLHQSVLYGVGPAVAQREVVLGGAAFVAMSLDRELDVRMLAEELRIALDGRLLIRPNGIRVVVEVHVSDALSKQFLLGCRGRRWWRRWGHVHGDAGRCFLGSSRTLGDQVVSRRVGGRHLLRPVGLHRADAVNADVAGQRGLPGQRGGLSPFNRVGVGRQRRGGRGWRRWRRWRRWSNFLLAGAQHHDCAKDEYESDPLHFRVFHILLPQNRMPDFGHTDSNRRRGPTSLRQPEMNTLMTEIASLHFCPLLPSPIWLRVAATERQLLNLRAVGQHGPYLLAARTAGLEHDVSSIRRPGRKIVASTIVRQLDPLLAGDIHQVDVVGSRSPRSIFAKPGQGQKLSVG